MADDVKVRSPKEIIAAYKKPLARELRKEGRRVLKNVRESAPKRTGGLRKKIKMRVKWDGAEPYVRITTGARRTTKHEDGTVTRYRYGLAEQKNDRYMQKGLARTPRR